MSFNLAIFGSMLDFNTSLAVNNTFTAGFSVKVDAVLMIGISIASGISELVICAGLFKELAVSVGSPGTLAITGVLALRSLCASTA